MPPWPLAVEEGREAPEAFLEVSGTYQGERNAFRPGLQILIEPFINVLQETGFTGYAESYQALTPKGG